jgi:hypothetical protein
MPAAAELLLDLNTEQVWLSSPPADSPTLPGASVIVSHESNQTSVREY